MPYGRLRRCLVRALRYPARMCGRGRVASMIGHGFWEFGRQLPQPKNFLPHLFVLGIVLDVFLAQRIDLGGTGFFYRFDVWMRRKPAALRVNFLTLFAGGPTRKEQSRNWMRRVFENRGGVDRCHAFAEHIVDRRALLYAARIMMRITCQTSRRLPGKQQLSELSSAPCETQRSGLRSFSNSRWLFRRS